MNVLKERTDKRGKRIATVELDAGEHIVAFNPNSHYKMGYPIEDIVSGFEILESKRVFWCSIAQEWQT